MSYSSADFQDKHTPILEEIDEAAYEIINDRPEVTRFVSMRKSQIGLTATVSNPSPSHQH